MMIKRGESICFDALEPFFFPQRGVGGFTVPLDISLLRGS